MTNIIISEILKNLLSNMAAISVLDFIPQNKAHEIKHAFEFACDFKATNKEQATDKENLICIITKRLWIMEIN